MTSKVFLGLDLAKAPDYTAVALLEQADPNNPSGSYHVLNLRRFPLGSSYTKNVARVVKMLHHRDWTLVADATGVGVAVFDMMETAGLRPVPITIHGGATITRVGNGFHVPKRELVDKMVVFMESGRLYFNENLPEVPAMIKELQAFKYKIDINTGHDTYGSWREGSHDDLILAVSMALWYADRDAYQRPEVAPNVFYDCDPRILAQMSTPKPTYVDHNWIDCKVKDCPDCQEEYKAAIGRGEI